MSNELTRRRRKPGSFVVGAGIAVAVLGLLLDWFLKWSGGQGSIAWIFLIAGAVIVIIGYLRRIAVGIENKPASRE